MPWPGSHSKQSFRINTSECPFTPVDTDDFWKNRSKVVRSQLREMELWSQDPGPGVKSPRKQTKGPMTGLVCTPPVAGTSWHAGIQAHWTAGVDSDWESESGAESPQCLQDNVPFPILNLGPSQERKAATSWNWGTSLSFLLPGYFNVLVTDLQVNPKL